LAKPKKLSDNLPMDDKPSEQHGKGTQHLSVEIAAFAISILLLYQRRPDLFISFFRLFFEDPGRLPPRQELLNELDPMIKEAAELVSGLQIFEGFLRNRTAQSAVAFVYIAYRYLLYKGETPSRAQSIQLWKTIWEKVKHVPIVACEWREMEKRGDLKGWMADVQEAARRQLRTFKAQLPRIQRNGVGIYRSLLAVFGEEVDGGEGDEPR
jgi:hypothetical protein